MSICFDCVMFVANGEAPDFDTEAESAAWQHDWNTRNAGGRWFLAIDEPHFSHGPCPACNSNQGGNFADAEFVLN